MNSNHNEEETINLKKKRKIAKDKALNNKTLKKLSIDHNVSRQVVRSAISMTDVLINVESDDPILQNTYFTKKTESKTTEIDQYILNGLEDIRGKNGIVNKHTLQDLANRYKSKHEECSVAITPYFFKNFKKRNNVVWRTLYGESRSADMNNILEWFQVYNLYKSEYEAKDIFNLDETGLFIKNFGNKSYVIKDVDDRKNIKLNKTRVTLLLAFNRFGEELPPLVISKSKRPRCFKIAEPEVFDILYDSNDSAWLTRDIFASYLNKINQELVLKDRKILLLMDNFAGHDINEPSNIRFLFL
ncbi:Tigger transposable element-derived protein 4, partial [Nosema granulosis]